VVREARLQGLFARVPVLFRTDFLVAKLGEAAYSRTPRPQGRHSSYSLNFSVPRVLGQNVMTATRVPGWPPRYENYGEIEQTFYMHDEIEAITAPLRHLCQKNSVSEDAVQLAIETAQGALLTEFARVCAEIREHFPAGLPRSIALPSLDGLAQAAE
jgi:hypothetical protein